MDQPGRRVAACPCAFFDNHRRAAEHDGDDDRDDEPHQRLATHVMPSLREFDVHSRYRLRIAGLPLAIVQTAGVEAKLPLPGLFVRMPAVPS
jgi:hypothetical protein